MESYIDEEILIRWTFLLLFFFFIRYPILARSGVRYVYKENGNTLAQDLEPEHITFSADEKKAYISLQVQCFVIEGTTR